jgi:hypothetical protein
MSQRRAANGRLLATHGHFKGDKPSPEYTCWDGMLGRCERPSSRRLHPKYAHISVCKRWKESFEAFLADMGPRPSRNHQIERIDNSRDYSPENCRWATCSEQARNRRSNLMLTFRGETLPAVVWAEKTGLPVHTIWTRKHRGWSDARTLMQERQDYPVTIKRKQG